MAGSSFPRILFIAFCLVELAWLPIQAQTSPVLLIDSLHAADISASVAVLSDPTRQLTLAQARSRVYRRPGTDGLNFRFSQSAVWLRFSLRQPVNTPHDYVLQLTNWYIDEADLYSPQPNGSYQVERVGDLTPLRQRVIKSRYPTASLHLPDNQPRTFYLRVSSTQYQTFAVQVWPRALFFEGKLVGDSADFALGLIAMRFAFHLALLVFLFSDTRFRAYSLFGISICLIYFFSGGNGTMLFPDSPYLANVMFFVALSLIPASLSYLVATVMEIPARLPRLVPLFWGFGVLGLVNLAANLFVRHAWLSWAFIGFMSLMLLLLMLSIGWAWARGARPTIWYMLPLLIYIPPFCLFYARNAGLHSLPMTETGMRVIFFVEFLCVPFIMAAILRSAYRERLAVAQNLVQREAEQANLMALDVLKTRFFTNISHEFRTPLTLLIGPLTDLRQRFPAEELYQIMHRNANRLHVLINQLLDLAKLDDGQLRPELRPGDLAADTRMWVTSFESLVQTRQITLSLTQSHLIYAARYDADKLEKITNNLVANALKFTPPGGQVRVNVNYGATQLILTVSDTGDGIPAEHLPHIFDRFYQVDASQRRGYEGTGVGLALVQELARVLDGSIAVASTIGVGTTFTLTVPLLPSNEPIPTLTPDTTVFSPLPTNGHALSEPDGRVGPVARTVLVVEDNDDLRAYVRQMLSPDYTTLEAADGQQGLDLALEQVPDLVVCDVMMPRLDGFGLCQALRADARTSHIPVVMLTALATLDNRLTGLQTGADDYLTKPFDRTELRLRVANLLTRQANLRQYLLQQLTQPDAEPSTALGTTIAPTEQAFLNALYAFVEQQIDNSNLDVNQLAAAVAMSSRTLNRKLTALLGMSTNELIRSYRMRRAAEWLRSGLPPAETAYRVGFDNPSYFSRVFRERYGQTPTEFINSKAVTEKSSDLSEK